MVSFIDFKRTTTLSYIVLELAAGGELYHRIGTLFLATPLPESLQSHVVLTVPASVVALCSPPGPPRARRSARLWGEARGGALSLQAADSGGEVLPGEGSGAP